LILAEIVLSNRDQEIQSRMPSLVGMHYYDDYELHFRSFAEAEEGLSVLQAVLEDYGLVLNQTKTRIRPVPQPLELPWVDPLRRATIRAGGKGQGYDLLAYFDRMFEQANLWPDQHVMDYGVGRFDFTEVDPRNLPLLQQLLLQATNVEPGVLRRVVSQFASFTRRGDTVDRVMIGEVLTGHVARQAPIGHNSEVAWALWGAIELGCQLGASASDALDKVNDDVVALIALDADARGGVLARPLDKTSLLATMEPSELRGEHWLLSYEAAVKKWLPCPVGHLQSDSFFGQLAAAGVSFYDQTAVSKPAAPRPGRSAVAVGYARS
jgi:hypothetical protein